METNGRPIDLAALRDLILQQHERSAFKSLQQLYDSAAGRNRSEVGVPVSRAQFYRWFGSARAEPDSRLLLLVPGLSTALRTPQASLLAEAGFADLGKARGVELQRDFRVLHDTLRSLSRNLDRSSFADQSEAVVVDRILRAQLDYEIGVWPVVRGASFPMQLRSWISLRRISTRSLRPATTRLEALSVSARREHIRSEVITDDLWRSLGLRWRVERPVEWPTNEDSPLRIELPVDEGNQRAGSAAFDLPPGLSSRVLVLSGLWGHAETLAALLAAGLSWDSIDLRYTGFHNEREEAEDFTREQMRASTPHVVWSLAQRARATAPLLAHCDELPRQPIVLITYGDALVKHAARAFPKTTELSVLRSQRAAAALAQELNKRMPVVHVALSDDDLTAGRTGRIDVDLVVDHVRYSAIHVLALMERHLGGPPASTWRRRKRFKDSVEVLQAPRASEVSWREPGTLTLTSHERSS